MPSLMHLRPDPIIQRLNDWMENWDPLHRDGLMRRDHLIRVEETMRDGTLEIRAEIPGVLNPSKNRFNAIPREPIATESSTQDW